METFARFGARLDENSRKILAHGKRIRSCLQQPELDPVSVREQISLMRALTARLFDPIPEENMVEAQKAVRTAANSIPKGLIERLNTSKKLEDKDREEIVKIVKAALQPLQQNSETPAPEKNSSASTPKEKIP